MKSNALGVVVVRLQVPELHAGHRYLLNTVTTIHKNVLVIIGETEARLTPEDPLPYETRAAMLKAAYPNAIVTSLRDRPNDNLWSQDLDYVIAMTDIEHGDVFALPVLYGGRDSFLQHYKGGYRTFELPPIEPVSGTDIRGSVALKNTTDFREGMIYASKHKYPISYQCVDVAIWFRGELLIGQKKTDNGKWRFIGGFVNPSDVSLEAAALREMREETGAEPGEMVYIGSSRINEYRYPASGTDRLMSAFFFNEVPFAGYTAADDIDACRWVGVAELEELLVPEHLPLFRLLLRFLADRKVA